MKRMRRGSVAAALIVAPLACHHHAAVGGPASNFPAVRLRAGGQVTTARGEPYTGVLVARDQEVAAVARSVLAGTPLARDAELDTRGLILQVPVDGGRLSGRATLHVDLRSAALSDELEGRADQLSLTVARAIAPTVALAEATFVAGELDGPAVVFAPAPDASGRMVEIAEAEFSDNRLHGVAREYSADDGQLEREMAFDHGRPAGVQRRYYQGGTLESEATYADGRLHGVMTEYYEDGSTRAEMTFREGEVVGTRRRWFPTGQLQLEATSGDDGDVVVTEWYSNGDVKSRVASGEQHEFPPDGLVVEYHNNGAVRSRTRYVDGLEHGLREVFYSTGGRRETRHFEAGQPHGPQRKWWTNGRPALRATWVRGELDGSFERWYASGQRWEQATYRVGKRVGPYRKWWKNGAVAHDYRYVDGKLDGEYRTFYDDGATWAVATYAAGKPQGAVKRWFPDGRLGYVMNHEDGRPHGPYRRWYADGTPRLKATYVHGRLHGAFDNWLEDGSVYELAVYDRGKKIETTLTTPAPTEPG